jgi:putative hydrolase of the HAD superfamily
MRGVRGGIRAVVFDLWETLIDWDREGASRMLADVAAVAGAGFGERWNATNRRYVAPIRTALAEVGVADDQMDRICAIRLDYHRAALVPRTGAVETLRELKRRGYLVGLITVCSEDVELLWPESEFAGHFDAEVFSSQIGLSKPDPRIYLHCCELLGVEPRDAVFVGDVDPGRPRAAPWSGRLTCLACAGRGARPRRSSCSRQRCRSSGGG